MIAELSRAARFKRGFIAPKVSKPCLTKKQIEILRNAVGSISEPNIDLNKIRDFSKYEDN